MRRGPLAAVMVGSLVVGLALMLPFEAALTRALGVAALFAFVISGVFLIADPGFLEANDDEPGARDAPASQTGAE